MSDVDHYCHFIEKVCASIEHLKHERGLFFAYPSKPETSADAIRQAIKELRSNKTINISVVDWADLPIEGSTILCEICKGIRRMSCVVVNTTYVNFNVLFEYGLAIGTGRAIWPLVEEGISRDELVSTNVKTITTIGYSQFSNSASIYKKIIKKNPWDRVSHFDLPEWLGSQPTREAVGVFYMKSAQNNEPSLRISESLSLFKGELIIDDPVEVPFQHVVWYLNQIKRAYAVVIHLGNERMEGAHLHWAKCALVAGMALALGRRLLILGEDVSFEPIDYRDLIRSYKNAHEAETIVKTFMDKIAPEVEKYKEYASADIALTAKKKGSRLSTADVGDYIAENEQAALQSYFIDTPEFEKALQPKCTVFVGRKGSGKSANFYMLVSRLVEDKRGLVCAIKPKEYELNELVQFIKNELDLAKKGYLVESLWKFMLYSEVLATIRDRINKSPSALYEVIDTKIVEYLESGKYGTNQSFTSRLTNVVRAVCNITAKSSETQVAVSEILHVAEINRMSEMLCEYIKVKEIKHFSILIDGLDANWRLGENHEIMSDILLALIGSARDIWRDCSKNMIAHEYSLETTIAIFIRSDVFSMTLERARDPDKLQFESLYWPTVDSLIALVNKRIIANSAMDTEVLNWTEILDPGFGYDEMKTMISRNVLPRPRDVIYYFQRVLYFANLRGTKYITKRDFQSAMEEYSQWALLSLSAEAQPYIPSMLDLLLEFDQKREVLTMEEINRAFLKAGVSEREFGRTLNFLVDINFLGYGIDANNYRFPSSPTEEAIMKRRFLRHIKGDMASARFKIHNAFHPVLSLQ